MFLGHSQLGCSVRYLGYKMLVKCQGLSSWESSTNHNLRRVFRLEIITVLGILYGDSIIWPIECFGLDSQAWLVECFGSLLNGLSGWESSTHCNLVTVIHYWVESEYFLGHSQLGCSVRYLGHKMLVKCQGLSSWESSMNHNLRLVFRLEIITVLGILYGDSIFGQSSALGWALRLGK